MAETIDYRTSGIVTKPVSLKAVADLLNSSGVGKNAAYDVGSVCTSDRINKWARRKPFNSNKLFFAQDTDNTATDREDALSNTGVDVRYGLKVNSISERKLVTENSKPIEGKYADKTSQYHTIYNYDISQDKDSFLYKLAAGKLDDWTYIPRTAPYRLADFIGYKHDCVSPLPTVESAIINGKKNDSIAVKAQINQTTVENVSLDMLSLAIGVSLNNFYIGILFYNSDYTNCFALTSSTPLSSLPISEQKKFTNIGVRLLEMRSGEFSMKTFLCSKLIDESTSVKLQEAEDAYLVGGDMSEASACTIYVITNKVVLKVETLKSISQDGNRMSLRVSIENNSGVSVYITGACFKGCEDTFWTDMDSLNSSEPLGSTEKRTYSSTELDSITINNNTTFMCKVNGTEISCTGGQGASAEYEIPTS